MRSSGILPFSIVACDGAAMFFRLLDQSKKIQLHKLFWKLYTNEDIKILLQAGYQRMNDRSFNIRMVVASDIIPKKLALVHVSDRQMHSPEYCNDVADIQNNIADVHSRSVNDHDNSNSDVYYFKVNELKKSWDIFTDEITKEYGFLYSYQEIIHINLYIKDMLSIVRHGDIDIVEFAYYVQG